MKITEFPISPEISQNLVNTSKEASEILGVSLSDPPLKVVEAIQDCLVELIQSNNSSLDKWTDCALPMGTLWGIQMVRQFQWQWASVTKDEGDGSKAFGVFDGNRSLAAYPFSYVFACLDQKIYPAVLLSFNMLLAGKIPELEAGGYMNLMDGVQHVVPPG